MRVVVCSVVVGGLMCGTVWGQSGGVEVVEQVPAEVPAPAPVVEAEPVQEPVAPAPVVDTDAVPVVADEPEQVEVPVVEDAVAVPVDQPAVEGGLPVVEEMETIPTIESSATREGGEVVEEVVPVEQAQDIWVVDTAAVDEADSDDESQPKTKPLQFFGSPYTVRYDTVGRPLLSTVRSVDVKGGETSYCSMIARLNKQQFFPQGKVVNGLGGPGQISVGNATQLVQYGLYTNQLTRVDDVALEAVLNQTDAIAVDLYLYKPHSSGVLTLSDITNFDPRDTLFDRYLMQGHRLVIFRGDDGIWYALDTIRGTKRTTPQPLSQYIQTPYNRSRGYYIHSSLVDGSYEQSIVQDSQKPDLTTIYPYEIPASRLSPGPRSMVSLYDMFMKHQLDLVEGTCDQTIADDDHFFIGGMTLGGTGAFWYEKDRHIWSVDGV